MVEINYVYMYIQLINLFKLKLIAVLLQRELYQVVSLKVRKKKIGKRYIFVALKLIHKFNFLGCVITLLTGYSTHHKLGGIIGCSGWLGVIEGIENVSQYIYTCDDEEDNDE